MDTLSDELLIDTYKRAISIGLDDDFIEIIESEMRRRKLKLLFKNHVCQCTVNKEEMVVNSN